MTKHRERKVIIDEIEGDDMRDFPAAVAELEEFIADSLFEAWKKSREVENR